MTEICVHMATVRDYIATDFERRIVLSNIFDDFPKVENGVVIDDFNDMSTPISDVSPTPDAEDVKVDGVCSTDSEADKTEQASTGSPLSDFALEEDVAPDDGGSNAEILSTDEVEVLNDIPDSSLDIDIDLKYQRFIDYYLTCGNKTKAAKLAGFTAKNDESLRVIASKAFKRPEVMAYFKLRKAELAAKADIQYDAYMSELVSIATLDIADVVDSHLVANTIEGEPVYVVTFKDITDIPVYARKAVKQIKINKDGSPEMIFYDKIAALKLLGEIKGYLGPDANGIGDDSDVGVVFIPEVLPDDGSGDGDSSLRSE